MDALDAPDPLLAREAALRQRSLQRTRKRLAQRRRVQRQHHAQRLVAVGRMVEAHGLLWCPDAILDSGLKMVARMFAEVAGEDERDGGTEQRGPRDGN